MTTLTHSIKLPPGRPPAIVGGNLLHYRRDALGYLTDNARRYGDVVLVRFGKYLGYQINHPDDVQQVLVKQAHKFHKAIIYKATLSEYLGNGLLISDGDFWRRQRSLAQPAFHYKRVQAYADVMTEYSLQMRESWRAGETRDIAHDMMSLTLFIVAKTLFDTDIRGEQNQIAEALEVLLRSVIEQSQKIIRLPDWVPTPARQRKRWSIDTLHEITMEIIQQRRASGEDKGDLLSMLISAESETGERMTDEQVRDEALTIVLAGHETTANAMTWTFYLLSEHPEVEARLREEVVRVLGDRPPTLADLPQLTYTEQVIKESMRLYPPAWSFARSVIEEVELGGYTIPKYSTVIILPYVIHRDARWFADPERFDPDRFSPAREASLPKYAYLPFGGGPRICIGNAFAMMEAKLILAAIVQRWRLRRASDAPVVPEPLVTLRPKGGMPMRVEAWT
ncbi:cytochrome P450 [Aggregatilineales bacterium SYSU G02658]